MKTLLERLVLTEKIPPVPVHDRIIVKDHFTEKSWNTHRRLLTLLKYSKEWPKDVGPDYRFFFKIARNRYFDNHPVKPFIEIN